MCWTEFIRFADLCASKKVRKSSLSDALMRSTITKDWSARMSACSKRSKSLLARRSISFLGAKKYCFFNVEKGIRIWCIHFSGDDSPFFFVKSVGSFATWRWCSWMMQAGLKQHQWELWKNMQLTTSFLLLLLNSSIIRTTGAQPCYPSVVASLLLHARSLHVNLIEISSSTDDSRINILAENGIFSIIKISLKSFHLHFQK